MKEKKILSNRGHTYYWVSKHSDSCAITLVFLHGLTANHCLFDQQINFFRNTYSIIVWDSPAHGKSRPYTDFSYANLAEELKIILDTENMKKAVLVCQSAGGFTGQSFIAKYPGMVEGLVMIGSCPYGKGYYSRSDFFWLSQTKWMFNMYPDKILRKAISKMCCITANGQNNMMDMLKEYSKKELCKLIYLGFAGFITEVHDLKINCPVCLIVGDHDKTGKVQQYNERWHKNEGYKLYIIKNAAHNANADNPNEVNNIIQSLLNTL